MLLGVIKGKRAPLNHSNQFIERALCVGANFIIVAVDFRVAFEVLRVQYLKRKIGRDQNVQIQIHVAQSLSIKSWRHIDVAVIIPQLAVRLRKAKDIVPTIEPVVLKTVSAAGNGSQ